MNEKELRSLLIHQRTLMQELINQKKSQTELLKKSDVKKCDWLGWFTLGTSFLSTVGIAALSAAVTWWATYNYKEREVKNTELQTAEKFMPYLAGMQGDDRQREDARENAILAISSLGNTDLAINLARLHPSKGARIALEQIMCCAENEQTRERAAKALILFGADAAPALMAASKQPNVSTSAANALAEIQSTQTPDVQGGSWVILAGSDTTLEAAKYEYDRAVRANYKPELYKRGRWFVTTIGSFNSKGDAEKVLSEVQSQMRGSAFIVDLNSWCPKPNSVEHGSYKYKECTDTTQ
jgi:hypothetical protein